jgi:hypothetical protein
MGGLLKTLTKLKQLDLHEMSLTASHIETIPKLLESTGARRLQVLHMRHN